MAFPPFRRLPPRQWNDGCRPQPSRALPRLPSQPLSLRGLLTPAFSCQSPAHTRVPLLPTPTALIVRVTQSLLCALSSDSSVFIHSTVLNCPRMSHNLRVVEDALLYGPKLF